MFKSLTLTRNCSNAFQVRHESFIVHSTSPRECCADLFTFVNVMIKYQVSWLTV